MPNGRVIIEEHLRLISARGLSVIVEPSLGTLTRELPVTRSSSVPAAPEATAHRVPCQGLADVEPPYTGVYDERAVYQRLAVLPAVVGKLRVECTPYVQGIAEVPPARGDGIRGKGPWRLPVAASPVPYLR